MPTSAPNIETIRKGLIGALSDFVNEAGFIAQINLIVELVYELAEYREEDIRFFPGVYVVKRHDDSDTLAIIAPGADRIGLKTIELVEGCGATILKDTAAMADSGWSIFVDVSDATMRYGLFRSEMMPVSLSSADHMADPDAKSGSSILLRNCARNCVELVSSDGKRLEFGLTANKPTQTSVSESFHKLAVEATRTVPETQRDATLAYTQRLIVQVCQQCHGTIIAVLRSDIGQLPIEFHDGVRLEEPVDLLAAFHELQGERSAATLSRLLARETLFRGMIQSDGITILNSFGQILAFRVFVKPNQEEQGKMNQINIRGGARSRAFELMKLRLSNSLSCVFFRSQDGNTMCEVKND